MREISNYIGRTTSKNPGEFTKAIDDLSLPSPTEPSNAKNQIEFEKWKANFREWRELTKEYTTFQAKLYLIVFGQCSDAMPDKLRTHTAFETANQNGIELLKIIRQILYTYEDTHKVADSICSIKEQFYSMRQRNNQSLQDYYEQFLSHVEVVESLDITMSDTKVAEEFAQQDTPKRTVVNDSDHAATHMQVIAI